jgi:hypothetical protein
MYYRRNVLNKQKTGGSRWWPRLLLLCILLGSIVTMLVFSRAFTEKARNTGLASSEGGANTKNTKNTGAYGDAKRAVEELSDKIYQRFEFHNDVTRQFFFITLNIPERGWDILKYKMAKKMLDGHSTFLMIFSGTSVTAGYDNHFNESYPMVFEKRMRPIFDALRIKLVVRNIAQRRVSCHMSNFCLEAMGGPDADFIGWENSYRFATLHFLHSLLCFCFAFLSVLLCFALLSALLCFLYCFASVLLCFQFCFCFALLSVLLSVLHCFLLCFAFCIALLLFCFAFCIALPSLFHISTT